jgi:hypothetical protein
VPGECSGGVLDGGDTGESSPTTAFPALVQPFLVFGVPRVRGVVGTGVGVRLVVAVDTLLGPEKTNMCPGAGWFGFLVMTAACSRTVSGAPCGVFGCLLVGVVVVVCLLRIAQWMRAS